MSIGNFVAVNAYVSSMFAPLAFLGYIYQGIIQGTQPYTRTPSCIDKSINISLRDKNNDAMLNFSMSVIYYYHYYY
jgi:ABC-type transport system involved in Fe-S cluster assembly fused permease/ATPase subunit